MLIASADWSINPRKRRVTIARGGPGEWTIDAPHAAGEPDALIDRLRQLADKNEPVILGIDHPIGVPTHFAREAGWKNFKHGLASITDPDAFLSPSDSPSLDAPFFPKSRGKPGDRERLSRALHAANYGELLRKCERPSSRRLAAGCLFFTCGAQQVGKGAAVTWRSLLMNRWQHGELQVWPFDGTLNDLLQDPKPILAETYPGEAYSHIGIRFSSMKGGGKTSREARRQFATALFDQCEKLGVTQTSTATECVRSGFDSDDDFDSFVALFSMLQVAGDARNADEPDDLDVRSIEGWIFSQPFD